MANTAWYAGKGYAMRGIRSPGSPCFDSLLYLTHEQVGGCVGGEGLLHTHASDPFVEVPCFALL